MTIKAAPSLLIALLVTLCPSASAADAPRRLNVLFIFSDDLRPELACYGVAGLKTPNIDALASAGVRFDRAFVQYPLCNPSRSSMLTGRYPGSTGVFDNTVYFRDAHPDWVTLPQHFKNNGYITVRVGKVFHGGIDDVPSWTDNAETRRLNAKNRPNPKDRQRNSDRIVVLEGNGESNGDYKSADQAIEYLEKYKDKPFFITCGFNRPHSPPTAPKRFFDMYDTASVPLPIDFAPRPAAPPGFPPKCITPNGDLFINRDASEQEAKEMKRAYWASLTWVDWNVGRVMAALDRLDLRDKTVVVFWGDHGYHLGEKGKWSKHQSLFDTGTRVPFIIAAPGAAGNGKPSPRVVQMIELYPTLAELCGLPKPQDLPSRSLAPLLSDPNAAWDHPAYSYGGTVKSPSIAVRTEKWRYAEFDNGQAGSMLIDEQNDPHELKNLAREPSAAETVKQMRDLLNGLPGLK